MGASIVAIFFFAIAVVVVHVYASESERPDDIYRKSLRLHQMQGIRAAFSRRVSSSMDMRAPIVYHVTSYGADPTGRNDSTEAVLKAITDALNGPGKGDLFEGIVNLGGARVDLDGGNYLISRPLLFPVSGRGNLAIQGGSITASNDFPTDGFLIDLSSSSNSAYNYEFTTLRDLYLDSNYRGGGIRVKNSLRTTIDNCYITHFSTTGILAEGGHETIIRTSYLGQHITAGADPGERSFSGTAISLAGNDNVVSDVVIFSAQTGILLSGQANLISGVHCYNKATGFSGVGIYVQLPGLAQTRIVDSYLDYTGIVAEDPVQLTVANTFFLGDAFILFKSVKGVMSGVTVVDNMFAGSDKGIEIVQMEGKFDQLDQVAIERNTVKGMAVKTTVARASVDGGGPTWTADLKAALLFPNLIKQVQYTFVTDAASYPSHFLRNVSDNKVVIQADEAVPARVYITADQGGSYL
ncbi:polygalacturonase QRT3-like [Salvia splendens]|uniref:polygalacturonase QRT3-like n=1 Tax=Salvia splendens TaxID=180675 RepID=UPI001C26BCBB|nr:polygalacturonase QRT3-like [Salvia splendens]